MQIAPAPHVSPARTFITAVLRPVALLSSVACVTGAVYAFRVGGHPTAAWWLLAAALALSMLWQRGVVLNGGPAAARPTPASKTMRRLGVFVAICGAAIGIWATQALYRDWLGNFDVAWLAWLMAAVALGAGLDMSWGRWGDASGGKASPRTQYVFLFGLVAVAAVYRFASLAVFPGAVHVSQIEELQVGLWGEEYLHGGRIRWEFLSHIWLAALGIKLGGPTLLAMRVPFGVVGVLKAIPLFYWLRLTAGPIGAAVGTALFAFSFWDVMLCRIPTHQTTLLMAIAFALLAGPARRGRPSAYVWLGFLSGYVLYDYVAYRPLVLFVLIGALVMSFRDVSATWARRLARPLITLLIIAAMATPLFIGQLWGHRFWNEYMNGWNRAHAQGPYYDSNDTWTLAATKRINRSFDAAALFYFTGDANPAHNVGGRSLVDPVTATLLLFGIAYCLAHLTLGVFGLTLAALGVTLAGTLVATGNWDIGRAAAAVIYVYALTGYGAASVAAALELAWRQVGRAVALVALTTIVLVAGYLNTNTLMEFLTSPSVRATEFSSLAYFSAWLREHVRDGERVEGIAPFYSHVLGPNDSSWLRGRDLPGVLTPDVESTLRDWSQHPGPALLLAFAGPSTRDVKQYLESLFPGIEMHLDAGPAGSQSSIAYAHLEAPPPELTARLAEWRCTGLSSEFTFFGSNSDEVLARANAVAPFIDSSTWPEAARRATFLLETRVRRIQTKFQGSFTVRKPGVYTLFLEANGGQAGATVDGHPVSPLLGTQIDLDQSEHTIEVNGTFAPVEGTTLRLSWSGPDSDHRREVMPFYRTTKPSCLGGEPEPAPAP